MRTILACLGACLQWGPSPAADPPPRIEAVSGPPRLDDRGFFSPVPLVPRAEYLEQTSDEEGVPAKRDPWSDDAAVRYATIGHRAGERLTVAVRFGDGDKPQVIVDENANRDLRDDPVRTGEVAEAGHEVRFTLRQPPTPIALGFRSELRGMLMLMDRTLREGTVQVNDRRVAFAVEGVHGHYGEEWTKVYFDTDGNGVVDRDRLSDEVYTPAMDDHVNLEGRSWSFRVAEDGERLTLEALDERKPDRVRLAPGNPAPDFAFRDLDGQEGRLSDYRGRLLLLYLWGTWCGPCRAETPQLVEVYDRYHDRGFEILAVAKKDGPDTVRAYVAEHGIRWRQTIDEDEEPIVTLYRAQAIPSMMLIDHSGTIVDNTLRGPLVGERVGALLDAEVPECATSQVTEEQPARP